MKIQNSFQENAAENLGTDGRFYSSRPAHVVRLWRASEDYTVVGVILDNAEPNEAGIDFGICSATNLRSIESNCFRTLPELFERAQPVEATVEICIARPRVLRWISPLPPPPRVTATIESLQTPSALSETRKGRAALSEQAAARLKAVNALRQLADNGNACPDWLPPWLRAIVASSTPPPLPRAAVAIA